MKQTERSLTVEEYEFMIHTAKIIPEIEKDMWVLKFLFPREYVYWIVKKIINNKN